MKKYQKKYFQIVYFIRQWASPFFNPVKFLLSFPRYLRFFADWMKYSRMEGAESIRLLDTMPCLHDRTQTTDFNKHYFYQDIWAFRRICESKVDHHVDAASRVDFAGFLSAITKVTFIDIRPAEVNLKNFESMDGNILALPFKDNSIKSLSCLSVAEHIGLGRYDNLLDPLGTEKACRELKRVLQKGGNLYFSIPVGQPKLYFNSHRTPSFRQIIGYFEGLELIEFSGIDEEGLFTENIDINALEDANFKEGLFWFKKL
jgi:SAM-dependent methyltransferase